MKSPTLPKTLSILFFAQLLLCSSAFARESESRGRENEQEHHQSGGDHSSPTSSNPGTANPAANNYRARLVNTTGDRYPSGSVKRKTEFRRGKLTQDRFSSEISLAIPSTLPAVATLNDADSLDVELEFLRAGVPYARCQLALHSIRETRRVTKAEFKVDIENRVKKGTPVTRVRYGSCDTDLATPGNENAIPEVKAGDTVTVSGNGQVFLNGQF